MTQVDCAFLKVLADDLDAHGKQAIVEMRERDPSSYIRAIVALMPNEQVKSPLEELSDEEIAACLATLSAFVRSQGLH